jgi:hypothetical protein
MMLKGVPGGGCTQPKDANGGSSVQGEELPPFLLVFQDKDDRGAGAVASACPPALTGVAVW